MSKGAIRRANPDAIISHWYKLIDGLHGTSIEFYTRLQQVLCERRVPGLQSGRVEFREGGPFSAKGMFLRLKRERVVFEICAATFGTGYFVSWRMGERLLRLNFLGLIFLLTGIAAGCASLLHQYPGEIMFGVSPIMWGCGIALGVIVLFFCLARSAIALGLADLDACLLRTPVFSGLYERLFRPMTYYRADLALMYQAATFGVKLVDARERQLVLLVLVSPVQQQVRSRSSQKCSDLLSR